MAWEDDFLYPLILLVVGAGFSIGVGTWLTHFLEGRRNKQQNALEVRRQNQQNALEDKRKQGEIEVERRRKQLEIKVDIASEMAKSIAHQGANAITAVNSKKKKLDENERAAHSEDVKEWFTQVNTIRLKLEGYFPETDVSRKWHRYFGVLSSFSSISRYYFYDEPREDQKEAFKRNVQDMKNYLSDKDMTNWDRFTTEITYDPKLWGDVFSGLMDRGDKIIKEVLKLEIKVL
jgi:hypothetical protein